MVNLKHKDFVQLYEHLDSGETTKELNLSAFTNQVHQDNLNHPVHIIDSSDSFTPSSFIPFCNFGDDPYFLGKKIDEFPNPVCNSFVKTILNGQNCYSLDINEVKANKGITINKHTYKMGLNLLLDYNMERQVFYSKSQLPNKKTVSQKMEDPLSNKNNENEALIYISTIGKINNQQKKKAFM